MVAKSKSSLESSLAEFGVPVETSRDKESSSAPPKGKSNKKGKLSKKHRTKKSEPTTTHTEVESVYSNNEVIPESTKDLLDTDILTVPNSKVEEDATREQTTADQGAKDLYFVVENEDPIELLKDTGQSPKVSKKNSKKGGLSMFLSGALDDAPKEVASPPPTPRNKCPAWGGAKFMKGSASLREILDQQSKIKGHKLVSSKDKMEGLFDFGSDGKIKLSSFLPSSPIPVVSTRSLQASDGEISTLTWAASRNPPQPSKQSFRDIQMQQVKKHQTLSHSPKTRTAGFTIATSQGSPYEATAVSRWFKPEVETPSSIRSIQIEEKAMKDLKRFYNSVKIVKKKS